MIRLTLSVALAASLAFACSSEPEPPAPPPEAPAAVPTDEKPEAEDEKAEAEPAAEPQQIVATLGAAEGKVTVNRKPAEVGQELAQGDVVQTKGKKSSADIHMTDGSRIRLGAKAKLQLSKVETEVSVKLLLGKLYSWISPGTPYEVETTNAVAGVRGTKFFVEEKKAKTYVCVCEGTVAVKGEKNEEEVVLTAGQDSYARRKKAGPATDSSAQMIDDLNAVFDSLKPAEEAAPEEGEDAAPDEEEGEEPEK
ncbi:MAG: FecR family protein [Myxococcota bacterium]